MKIYCIADKGEYTVSYWVGELNPELRQWVAICNYDAGAYRAAIIRLDNSIAIGSRGPLQTGGRLFTPEQFIGRAKFSFENTRSEAIRYLMDNT